MHADWGNLDVGTLALVALSAIVVISYLFDLLGHRLRVPSVLLLLLVGVGLKYLLLSVNVRLPGVDRILAPLGATGLILIVLDAALGLTLTRGKLPLMGRALLSAAAVLVLTALGITALFMLLLGLPLRTCLVNAIPFAVISSAIAIPSVGALQETKREFVVYESTFSDILGIVLFTAALQFSPDVGTGIAETLGGLAAVVVIAVFTSALLLFILLNLAHHIKFFLVLSLLILLYGAAKLFHLSALFIVFVFGLAIANAGSLPEKVRRRLVNRHRLKIEVRLLRLVTAESAFLIRTFFFVLFGYSIQPAGFLNLRVVMLAVAIVGVVLIARFLYLRFAAHVHLFPELFVAPRGLITILLFYSIPAGAMVPGITRDVLFLVVVLSSAIMTASLMVYKGELDESLDAVLPREPLHSALPGNGQAAELEG